MRLHEVERANSFLLRIAVPSGWVYVNSEDDSNTFVPDPDADHVRELARQRAEDRRGPDSLSEYLEGWPTLEGMTPWRLHVDGGFYAAELGEWSAEVDGDGWTVARNHVPVIRGLGSWLAGARMAVGWLAKRTGAKLVDATE